MIEPYFQNIRINILSELNQAKKEIVVAVYWFTNIELFEKLCEKVKNGITVSLIIHNDSANNRINGLDFQKFIDLGGELYFSNLDNPMHNKFCVIDRKVLINGSYNWTYFAEIKNNENILLIKSEQNVIEAFRTEFDILKNKLDIIDKISQLSQYEIREFDGLNTNEYLANDMIYQAIETNRPDLAETAFKLSPFNIKIQQIAINHNLKAKRKLQCSIGASVKNNKFLVGVKKGTIIPISISRVIHSSIDNQVDCYTTISYGENELASMNTILPGKSSKYQIGGLKIKGLPPMPEGEAKMKIDFIIDIYGILKIRFYSLDNGESDFFSSDINNLIEV